MTLAEMLVRMFNIAENMAEQNSAALDDVIDTLLDEVGFRNAIASFEKVGEDLVLTMVDGSKFHRVPGKWEVLGA